MIRASWFLAFPAAIVLAAAAQAADGPVIINGGQTNPPVKKAEPGKDKLPVILNYPSALFPDAKPQGAAPNAPRRVAVSYSAPVGYIDPVWYNAYGYGPMFGNFGGFYDLAAPYGYGYGGWGGWGWGYGDYGWGGYGIGALFAPAYLNIRPPLVDVLSTGVRVNAGRLVSFPHPAPVFGQVIGVQYR